MYYPGTSLEEMRKTTKKKTHLGLLVGWNGPAIQSWWRQHILHLSRQALGPTQPPIQQVLGVSARRKVARWWHSPPTPSTAKLKRKSRGIPLLPLWAYIACYRMNFTFFQNGWYPCQ